MLRRGSAEGREVLRRGSAEREVLRRGSAKGSGGVLVISHALCVPCPCPQGTARIQVAEPPPRGALWGGNAGEVCARRGAVLEGLLAGGSAEV